MYMAPSRDQIPLVGTSSVEAGNEADVAIVQRRGDTGQIVGADEGVAVGDDQDIVSRRSSMLIRLLIL